MEKNEGILPTINSLISASDLLFKELEPIIEKTKDQEHHAVIESLLKSVHGKLIDLHRKVMVTHELIETVIRSIQSSRFELKKSVDGLIKKTGVQLQKITSTTEEATNKIMDIAEKLDDDQLKIIDLLEKLSCSPDDTIISKIKDIKDKIYKNQEAAFTIIDYLQFQDITAQQIAGAYSLLSETEKTLISVSNLLKEFDPDDKDKIVTSTIIDKKAFNADAAFSDKKDIQSAIDTLFNTGDTTVDIPRENLENQDMQLEDAQDISGVRSVTNNDIDRIFHTNTDNTVSDDDIDQLFKSRKDSATEEKTSNDDIDDLFKSKTKKVEKISDNDIDDLFNNKATQKVDNDDIDALFNPKKK